MISRNSVSSTCDPAPSTETRSCTLPGFASNVTREGTRRDEDEAAAAGAVEASATSGTRPLKYGAPSGPTAISDTRAGCSRASPRSPGALGSGSQTNVTRVLPFSPRDVPIQVRTTLARDGRMDAARPFLERFVRAAPPAFYEKDIRAVRALLDRSR